MPGTARVRKRKRKTRKTTLNGQRAAVNRFPDQAQEYEALMEKLGLNQIETGRLFDFAGRTSRRYKRGEGKVPLSILVLMRLMARGVISKRQVLKASIESPPAESQHSESAHSESQHSES